jgi:hypothetical protein
MPHTIRKNKIRFTEEEVQDFNRSWPSSNLQPRSYWFEFDENANLIDTDVPEQDDGPAAIALSHDAQEYLNDNPNETPHDSVLQAVNARNQ